MEILAGFMTVRMTLNLNPPEVGTPHLNDPTTTAALTQLYVS